MSSVIVECWNCGQKLNIRADKIASARCGNCQQMVLEGESPPQPEPKSSPPAPRSAPRDEPALPPRQQQKTKYESAKAFSAVRAITPKELLLGIGLSIAVALVLKVIYAYVYAYLIEPVLYTPGEPLGASPEHRRFLFTTAFDYSRLSRWIGFARSTLTLFLFFYLSLVQRVSRSRAYAITALVSVLCFAILVVVDFKMYAAESQTLSGDFYLYRWINLLSILLIPVGLVMMDLLMRLLFRLQERA